MFVVTSDGPMRAGRFLVLASVVCALAGGAWGQDAVNTSPASAPAPLSVEARPTDAVKVPLAFEVATVKLIDEHVTTFYPGLRVFPGGRLVIHTHRLAMLIAEAFNISEWQIVGGDRSVVQAWYDVEGKPSDELRAVIPGGEYSTWGIQDARVCSMLQALLIDRFHLKFHIESKPGTIYELKGGDGPLRLNPTEVTRVEGTQDSSEKNGVIGLRSGSPLSFHLVSMLQLAQALSKIKQIPVSDQTGLSGFYDFKSKTVATMEDFDNEPDHLWVDAVPEMGLKLIKANGLVEKFVIDSVELPTAN